MNSKSNTNLDLSERAKLAVEEYLIYARSLNDLPMYQPNLRANWLSFFDFNHHDNLFDYTDTAGHVLAALANKEVNDIMHKEIGAHYMESLATILRRVIYVVNEFETSEASKAELDFEYLDLTDRNDFGAQLTITEYTSKLEALKKRVAERPKS